MSAKVWSHAWRLPKPACWTRKRGVRREEKPPWLGERKGPGSVPLGVQRLRKTSQESEYISCSGELAQNLTGPSYPWGRVSPERYRPGATPGHVGEVPGAQEGSYPWGTAQTSPSPGTAVLEWGSRGTGVLGDSTDSCLRSSCLMRFPGANKDPCQPSRPGGLPGGMAQTPQIQLSRERMGRKAGAERPY